MLGTPQGMSQANMIPHNSLTSLHTNFYNTVSSRVLCRQWVWVQSDIEFSGSIFNIHRCLHRSAQYRICARMFVCCVRHFVIIVHVHNYTPVSASFVFQHQLHYSIFSSVREQDEACISSSWWLTLLGLEPAYISMWVTHSTTVLWTLIYNFNMTYLWIIHDAKQRKIHTTKEE